MALQPRRQARNWSGATSIVTAFTAVGALIFTALSLNATRDQVAAAQQGQYTDRYSRAVEQLGQQGPDKLQIRLGGIYALERLAHDSPRDQPTIIEVLSAFVRTNARQQDNLLGDCPEQNGKPREDVQAALTVIGRREVANDNGHAINLSFACLSVMDLRGANFVGADLVRVNLEKARLADADFSGAEFGYSVLRHANLDNAKFHGAQLAASDLTDVNSYAYDHGQGSPASFQGAFMGGAVLTHADLRGADLRRVNLGGATIVDAYLPGADLRGANLLNADLTNTVLSDAKLQGANLIRAIHVGAKIDDVVTDGATRGRWW